MIGEANTRFARTRCTARVARLMPVSGAISHVDHVEHVVVLVAVPVALGVEAGREPSDAREVSHPSETTMTTDASTITR